MAMEFRQRILRLTGFLGNEWQEALPEELQFWQGALKDGLSTYEWRLDPDLELQADLKRLIDAPPGALVQILDVGAGPLSTVGKKWEGRTVRLIPIDPLAVEYRTMLTRLKIQPPIFTEAGHGEKLLEKFPENYFDIAYASNSLDHSYDPLLAIRQMFAVVKPEGSVYLWHFANVAVAEGYAGLHQWNFDIKNGDMILSNGRGVRYSLAAEFKNVSTLKCEFQSFRENKAVVCTLKKLAVA
jgi:SAM-dependent methyltransferase